MPESAQRYGVPPLTAQHAARPRLTSMLDAAPDTPLVLVCAPAGSGKTALVAEWLLRGTEHDPTAWVTSEATDASFWPGVVTALARLGAPARAGAFPQGTSPVDRQVLLGLTSAVARLPRRVTLVLDGCELVDPGVADDLDFLLRHSGHRLRLVLVTRVDPVLPLYRYRLDETVTELRAADLAFTDAEATQLLRRSGVSVSPDAVHLLRSRTAGWAVGLRFAARILSAREDQERGVAEVTAAGGNLAEYLLGQVLDGQTPEVRRLLLSTSVPDALRPGLTEELAGRSGTRTLALLTRSNAFIEPVPERPGHYRYQPFFRDLLRAQLGFESPERLDELHRLTAAWFAREGLVLESVRHLAATRAWADAAAEIVGRLEVGELLLGGPDSPLARVLAELPTELHDPSVCVVRGVLALAGGDSGSFAEQLDLAARGEAPPPGPHARALALTLEVLGVVRSCFGEDPAATLALAERAERTLRARENRGRVEQHPELAALVLAARGWAEAGAGRLTEAYDAFAAAAGAAGEPGAEPLLVRCLGQMAVLACLQGQASRAETLARQAVDLADGLGLAERDRPRAASAALAWVGAMREDLRGASEQIAVTRRARPRFDDPVADTLGTVAASRVRAARGDLAGALEVVGERTTAGGHAPWLVDLLRLESAQLRIATGEPDLALLEIEDVGTAGHEPEVALLSTLADLARGGGVDVETLAPAQRPDAALPTQVGGWLAEAARQLRGGSAPAARSAVDRALRLATTDHLRLPFRQAPADVRRLLGSDVRFRAQHPWLAPDRPSAAPAPASAHPVAPGSVPLSPVVETLTGKELEVLGHLAELLTTEEIAETMFVTVNTIRTHVRSILRKLGVSRRNAAVRRARELDLLPV